MTPFAFDSWWSLWDVFLIFTIPFGGGIPAGVVLGQNRAVGWMTMAIVYLVSDVLLAFLFEPIMKFLAWASYRVVFLGRLREALQKSTQRTIAAYGTKPGPVVLISIAFGIDPMTGRAAALAAGHSFLSGWAIAITGDMIYFFLIMASTMWLNDILGDGTWAALIVMVVMMAVPAIYRRLRRK